VSVERITKTVYKCVCELPDCPGRKKPWESKGDKIPRACKWCYRRTWNGTDLRPKRLITVKGKTLSLGDWAKKSGLSKPTIRARIDLFGWSEDDAVSVPANGERKHHKQASKDPQA